MIGKKELLALGFGLWYTVAYLIKEPCHTSVFTGEIWVQELLHGNDRRFRNSFRMNKFTYQTIKTMLVKRGLLQPTKHITVDEQVAIFLFIVGGAASNRCAQERFQRSGSTINKYSKFSFN